MVPLPVVASPKYACSMRTDFPANNHFTYGLFAAVPFWLVARRFRTGLMGPTIASLAPALAYQKRSRRGCQLVAKEVISLQKLSCRAAKSLIMNRVTSAPGVKGYYGRIKRRQPSAQNVGHCPPSALPRASIANSARREKQPSVARAPRVTAAG
jgi:hypothetical protein